ncbi:hypothetical protein ACINKY_28840 [Paenibacillus illinoisensis]|uniref:Uncharacterized protein n=2 Tax=Paenibacillus illinoisensis TaxID=59845 RepID=A0ABW8I2T3_9BACL
MSTGLMFLVQPRSVTDASYQQNADRLATSRWIGGSLITMSALFLFMGALQLLDEASHHIGH